MNSSTREKAFCILTIFSLLSGFALGEENSEWKWLWPDHGDRANSGEAFILRKTIGKVNSGAARLQFLTDFAYATIYINDNLVAEVEAYDPPLDRDFAQQILLNQENTIRIELQSVEGPSAFAGRFHVGDQIIHIDSSWYQASHSSLNSLGPVRPERRAPNRLSNITPFAEYNQWKEALPLSETSEQTSNITRIAEGFTVEEIYRAKPSEDSWVSMAIDSQDRIMIAMEDRGILRSTQALSKIKQDSNLEVINSSLRECRGLLPLDAQTLYANANDSKALYRLRDGTGDGYFDLADQIQKIEGGAGHGRNDLALGPAGAWLHVIQGDSVKIPPQAKVVSLPEPDGSAELGYWSRISLSSHRMEVLARGLRNPYGIAFNSDGEAFTYDADNEGDVGLPFYRPTRINHLVPGANYGWHQQEKNSRNLPVYAPDTVPTTFDVGRGSPTAVHFGEKSNFPDKWKKALYALDWAYGRIVAVHLLPRGASYYASGETFLEGRPLNVTDMGFDSEGTMYFITGGRKTQSALYRVRYIASPPTPRLPSEQELARSKYSHSSKARRNQLENLYEKTDSNWTQREESLLQNSLGSADPWIRTSARICLEKRISRDSSDSQSENESLSKESKLATLTRLLSKVRMSDPPDGVSWLLPALDIGKENNLSRTEKLTFLRICELSKRDDLSKNRTQIVSCVEPWLFDHSAQVRMESVRILAPLGSRKAVRAGIEFSESETDQLKRLHYLEVLSEAPDPAWDEPLLRKSYFRTLGRASRSSQGDRFMNAFFEKIQKAALQSVGQFEMREELNQILVKAKKQIKESSEPTAETSPSQRPFVKNWKMKDFPNLEASVSQFAKQTAQRDKGKELYEAALCSRCHVCGENGISVGPSLSNVASRFTATDLLHSILEPEAVVSEVHRNVRITRKDGSELVGRVALDDFRKSLLYISTNPFLPDDLIEVPKNEIQSFDEIEGSPMPPALLNSLRKEEITTLLAWILQGGK